MPQQPSRSTPSRDTISALAQAPSLNDLGPIAARFVYSLRLIALHERARRDPVPELTARLGGIEIAAKSLALSQTIVATWPENVHLSRFCCPRMTHDEATIGALLDRAWARDRLGFDEQVKGLIRAERVPRLWDAVLELVTAEVSSV